MSLETYLLKIVRPVMVSGKMLAVGHEIEMAKREAIKLVEAGKAEFTKVEKEIEKAVGISDADNAPGADAPGGTADVASADPSNANTSPSQDAPK